MRKRRLYAIFAVVMVGSLLAGPVHADSCVDALSPIDQPGFWEDVSRISNMRALGLVRNHKVKLLKNPITGQTVVLLGESHVKKTEQTDAIDSFARRFGDIAVELVEGDREKYLKWASMSSSNTSQSLLLDSGEHRIHLIDRDIPAVLNPYNVLIMGMTAITASLGYATFTMFTSGASTEVWMQHLLSPPVVLWIPVSTALGAMIVYTLDGIIGLAAHRAGYFQFGNYLPATRQILNKRNVHMTMKIAELMNDQERKRDHLLVIVGSLHIGQMIKEMEKYGFYLTDINKD